MKRAEILKECVSYLTYDLENILTSWEIYLILLKAQKKKSYAVIRPESLESYLPKKIIKKLVILGNHLEIEDFMIEIYSSMYTDLETEVKLKRYLLTNFYGCTHIIFTAPNNLKDF